MMPAPIERLIRLTERDDRGRTWGNVTRKGSRTANLISVVDVPDLKIPIGYLLWPTAVTITAFSATAIPRQVAFSILDQAGAILCSPGVDWINPPLAAAPATYSATFRPDVLIPHRGSMHFTAGFSAAGVTNFVAWDFHAYITVKMNSANF